MHVQPGMEVSGTVSAARRKENNDKRESVKTRKEPVGGRGEMGIREERTKSKEE